MEGWPLTQAQQDVLITAPTGSGKTLTAFLAALDRLFRLALEGSLPDQTQVLYVSPLEALGNDVQNVHISWMVLMSERGCSRARAGRGPRPIRRTSSEAAMQMRPAMTQAGVYVATVVRTTPAPSAPTPAPT